MIKRIIKYFVCRWNCICPKHGLPTRQHDRSDGVNMHCSMCDEDDKIARKRYQERKKQKELDIRARFFKDSQ